MRGTASLGAILGIRTRLHYTWAIAFVFITAIVVTQFPEAYPLWQRMILGVTASLFFFLSISIRELVLSFTAIRRDIPLKSATLFVFGGVSQIAKEATLPILEVLLAVTGLLSNLVIAGIFYGVYAALVYAGSVVVAGLIQWLAFINFMLFLFHFIPGFPLDGGRILRALLWRATGDYYRATSIASWAGRGIGILLVVGGILALILTGEWFTDLLLAFMGWVLQSAAAQARRQAVPHGALQGVTARDIMTREYPLITQQLSLAQLVQDYILVTGQRYFVVADGVQLQGIVTMRNIKSIPKKRLNSTNVGEIMTPANAIKTTHPTQPAASLLEQMDESETGQMPVLEDDRVIGIVTRESLTSFVETRTELGV